MSGIAGVYHADQRPVDRSAIGLMVDAIAHRGPDGRNTWQDASVGLGHAMLHATPESEHTGQPLMHQSGDLVLTADARIDNRDALIRALHPPASNETPITDAELILAAYEQWGKGCPERLMGAFSFAIWDQRERHLFCARDHLGVKPFYYHHTPGQQFVFASEIKGVLAAGSIPRRVNATRVADYLAFIEDNNTYTFYQDINRLAPAHTLTIGRDGWRKRRYWSLSLPDECSLVDDEAIARFRSHFLEAVRRRFRAFHPIGAYLSGGLDSSSVVGALRAVADDNGLGAEAIHTFSAVFSDPGCDERPYIRSVLSHTGVTARCYALDRYNPVHDVPLVIDVHDTPTPGHPLSITRRLNPLLNDEGIRVVLEGHGGDEVVSHGYGHLAELARTSQWSRLYGEVRGEQKVSSWGLFLRYWLAYGSWPPAMERPLQWVTRRLGAGENPEGARRQVIREVVRPDFAAQTDLEERYRSHRRTQLDVQARPRRRHLELLKTPLQTRALEELDRTGAYYGLETRFPFWDRELIVFCLSLPVRFKRQKGVGRWVLRAAMQDLLPEEVRSRTDKADFQLSVRHAMQHAYHEAHAKWGTMSSALAPWVDPAAFNALYQRVMNDQTPSSHAGMALQMLGRLLQLGEWRVRL